MSDVQSLNHSKWECKYHITWIPKCRRKSLYGGLRKYLGKVFRELARQKECEILEGHLAEDHVHMLVASNPTQIRRIADHRLLEGQECNPYCQGLHGAEKKLSRSAFLGQRLPCVDSRPG
jgi:REP element-mobilizing transposase RayT